MAGRRPYTDDGEEGRKSRPRGSLDRLLGRRGRGPRFAKWWSQLRKDSEYDPTLCFIACDQDGVVGMIQCWTTGFVKDIAVHPRARRRGIGRALMLTAFEAFKARGAKHVDLKVREDNVQAQWLYHSLDMAIVAREPA